MEDQEDHANGISLTRVICSVTAGNRAKLWSDPYFVIVPTNWDGVLFPCCGNPLFATVKGLIPRGGE